MRTKKKRALARLQVQVPVPIDKAVRMLAIKHREYPSTTTSRLLAQALNLDPVALGIKPTNGSPAT